MAIYRYKALAAHGKSIYGVIDADNERDARNKLRVQGLMITEVFHKKKSSSRYDISGDQLVGFASQLAQMLEADVPLYDALKVLEEQHRGEKYHRILLSLCDNIKAGMSLSQAMAFFPKSFDNLFCGVVAAGEASGSLPLAFKKLSDLLTRKAKVKKQLITATIYPSVVLSFAMITLTVLLTFVVPSIEMVFEGRDVNPFTSFIIAVSHHLCSFWPFYLTSLLWLVGMFVVVFKSPVTKKWVDNIILRIPFFKSIVVNSSIARFASTMATTQQGGMTIIDALRVARHVVGNTVIKEELSKAEIKIVEGSALSKELKHSCWVPPLVSRMLAVGEESGNTVVIFEKIAFMYEEELEKQLARVAALITPVILIFTGLVVGMVMLAVLLPLTDINIGGGGIY